MSQFHLRHPHGRVSRRIGWGNLYSPVKAFFRLLESTLPREDQTPVEIGLSVLRIVLTGLLQKYQGFRSLTLPGIERTQIIFRLGVGGIYLPGSLELSLRLR